jgi:mannose-6-phosphate isomerase-like protein (cupin superfamily)
MPQNNSISHTDVLHYNRDLSMDQEETLLQTDTVRVRVMHLQPGGATAWHYHREVTDHMVCLTGAIQVGIHDPAETFELRPGQRCTVAVGCVHQVANPDLTSPASYLLIQGVGRYDFIPVEIP